ncbi:hypothetical protein H1Q59_08020 [Holosporaceae bacterium 'Namur']|nr:hypothetical protein [Holosporaceae bacterium 'Namur']
MPSFQNPLLLSELNGSNGFKLTIDYPVPENSFYAVDGIGDVNGDGIDDMIFGAGKYNDDVGITYVLYGSKTSFPPLINLSSLNGTNGFKLIGEKNQYFSGDTVRAV